METRRVDRMEWGRELWLALGFLTTLPLPPYSLPPSSHADADIWVTLGRASRWFPLVGLVLGGLLVMTWLGLRLLFPLSVVAILLLGLWVILTGGLHLDGVADCCDGLFASVPVERRLEIMRDPRVGAFGVIGLVLHLLLKATALRALLELPPQIVVAALLLAPTWARWHLVRCARLPSARPDGMGAGLGAYVTTGVVWTATVAPVALSLVTGVTSDAARTLGAVLAGWLASALVIRFAQRRLGGVTGDLFGAVVELTEIAILLVYTIAWQWQI